MKNNAIRIDEIILGLEEKEEILLDKILAILGLKEEDIVDYEIVKKAVDSRDRKKILFVYSVDVEIRNPENYLTRTSALVKGKMKRHRVRLQAPYAYRIETVSADPERLRPIVVGSGPSGLFAGLLLARAGMKPLIVERGKNVDARVADVDKFFATGELNAESNIQFGEGGAGTFSDGKLHTLVDNPRKKFIFEELIKSGAMPEIAYDAQPHIGTDKLRQIVKNIRQKIVRLGGEVRFETKLTDIEIVDGKIANAIFNGQEKMPVSELILATGHSARDTYGMLYAKKLEIQAKPFSIGVRIEHAAEMINKAQYGEFFAHPKLPTARYRLVSHSEKNRSVYSFCMCPGGAVIAAASEEGGLVTNGMSEQAQDGQNSNSALLVNVFPNDFGSDSPLAGIEFQREWEKKAFVAGGGKYKAPAQLVGDFLQNKPSEKIGGISSTYGPGVMMTTLDSCLPDYVLESLREALPILDRKVKGFAHPEAVLTGVETRSSSPVKIVRSENFQSNIAGIYPAGEGSGYAGGIVSAALDGMMVAEAIIKKYSKAG
ncbi:MAG: FAD-dependent monooxygenase [Parcubacteria group bacterium]